MIPDPDSMSTRFGLWLMEQPETKNAQIAVPQLLNVMSTVVTILRQTFKAIEMPHLMTHVVYRSETQIRADGGLWMFDANGERFRTPLAEETDQDSVLMDLLYAQMPDDVSDLEEN